MAGMNKVVINILNLKNTEIRVLRTKGSGHQMFSKPLEYKSDLVWSDSKSEILTQWELEERNLKNGPAQG